MMQTIDPELVGWLIKSTLQLGTPLVIVALGGMFSERSGIVNIGLEGMMLIGAFTAVAVTYFTDNPWLGVLLAVVAGAFIALIHAIVCIKFKGNHIVSGTGIILFAAGFTTLMLEVIWERKGLSEAVEPLPDIELPFLSEIPVIGTAFGELNTIIYFMFFLVIICWYVLYRTPFGLRLRAAGEDPSTLDTAGINVEHYRYAGVILSGCLAALGGAYLSIGFENAFGKEMTAGRGFIALAALIFGNWTPIGCLLAGLFFGFLDGLSYFIFLVDGFEWLQPYNNFIKMVPYLSVIIALAGIRKSIPPKAVGTPYEKEQQA